MTQFSSSSVFLLIIQKHFATQEKRLYRPNFTIKIYLNVLYSSLLLGYSAHFAVQVQAGERADFSAAEGVTPPESLRHGQVKLVPREPLVTGNLESAELFGHRRGTQTLICKSLR
mgnify:CR=1 FL=1